MRLRPCAPVLLFVPLLASFVAACVGDDPVVNDAATNADGGPSTTPDGGTTTGDSSTSPVDAATSTDGAAVTDAGGDSAPPGFDARSLPGLRLWLESTKDLVPEAAGSTGFGSWTDSSGRWDGGAAPSAPDGGKHVALPHNVNPPSIVANGINGRPTVSFVSSNGYLHVDNHEDFHFGLGDFLIVEVAKVSSATGTLWSLRPGATAGSEESFAPGLLCVSFGMGVTNGCTTAFTPSTDAHVYAARRKSDLFTIRVDGTVRATLDRSADPPDIFVNMFTAPYAFIGQNLGGQISEVIVVVGPTSDADLTKLEAQLKTKYALP